MQKPVKKKILMQHFSHEHILEHTRILPAAKDCTCFGCKRDISPGKFYYKCKVCPFYLHQICYEMPQKLQHPVDPNHQLTLLAMASPPMDSSVVCIACQLQVITGFYYNCAICGSFFHARCLFIPLSVELPIHSHALKLEFSPPYEFQCDICDKPSYLGWLYRCGICEFDAHISCVSIDGLTEQHFSDTTQVIAIDGKTNGQMKGIGGKNHQEHFDNQSKSQDLLSISTFHGTPSHQLFSIDLANHSKSSQANFHTKDISSGVSYSIELIEGENEDDSMLSNQAVDVQKKSQAVHSYANTSNKTGKVANSNSNSNSIGVKPHAWKELGKEHDSVKGETSRMDNQAVKFQAKKQDIRCKCLCW